MQYVYLGGFRRRLIQINEQRRRKLSISARMRLIISLRLVRPVRRLSGLLLTVASAAALLDTYGLEAGSPFLPSYLMSAG